MRAEQGTPYSTSVDERLRPADISTWTALDLFAGCGGLALGFEAAGFATIGFEMSKDACSTYNRNLVGECFEEFLTEDSQFPAADIVIGGPPCQPFSVSGTQKGRLDDRDGFPAFIAAVAQVDPVLFMFENVRGMLYRNREYYDTVLRQLRNLGYELSEVLLNAADFGVPQNRQRVVVVGHRHGFAFPEPLSGRVSVREALGSLLECSPPGSKFLTPSQDAYIARYEEKSKCVKPRDLHPDQPSRTLTCRNLGGATSDMHRVVLPDGRRRRLLVEEAARLQSFPDWFHFAGGESSQFDQIGNAVAPLFALSLAHAVRESLLAEAPISARIGTFREELTLFDRPDQDGGCTVFQKNEEVEERVRANKTFAAKPEQAQERVIEALRILDALGLPIADMLPSPRKAERMALALLAIADVKTYVPWSEAKDLQLWSLGSRQIIEWQRDNFFEERNPSSYDDIRRQDLNWMSLAGIARNTGEESAGSKNAPNRKFGLSPEAALAIRAFGTSEWKAAAMAFTEGRPTLAELLSAPRRLTTMAVSFAFGDDSVSLQFGPGPHNELIKEAIDTFLPIYGYGAEVLYVGDADDRDLYKNSAKLSELGVFDLAADELPDVVAFSSHKQWLYVIEAVHSSGPVSREKHLKYRRLFEAASIGVVYVTAFATREKFRTFAADIAWETEVWIAAEPTHLIHFNGDRFLGPHDQA
jgi:DNA-cytosine methyltransferase